MAVKPKHAGDPGALALVEESFALLRAELLNFGFYYSLGSIPFLLYFVYALEDTTVGVVQASALIQHATILTVLYFCMRALHCFACEAVRRKLDPSDEPLWSLRRHGRLFLQQARLAGACLGFAALSACIGLTAGFAYSYSHNAVACGYRAESPADCRRAAWASARAMAQTAHHFLAIYAILWIALWANVAMLFYFLPSMLQSFFGIETALSISGWNLFGATFLALSGAVTSFLANPLAKIFHVNLCYRRESRSTGRDLLARLARIPAPRAGLLSVVALTLLAIMTPDAAAAQDAEPDAIRQRAEQIDYQAERQLALPEFNWRMRAEQADQEEATPALIEAVQNALEVLSNAAEAVGRFWDWLWGNGDRQSAPIPGSRDASGATGDAVMRALSVVGIIALLGLTVYALLRLAASRQDETDSNLAAPLAREPDLEDETVTAAQLPTDRWLALARQKAAEGEYRLATRALFLGTLSHLADRRYIALAKSKGNLEYERELRGRGFAREGQDAFSLCRAGFDRIWYGRYEASSDTFEQALARYEQLKGLAS